MEGSLQSIFTSENNFELFSLVNSDNGDGHHFVYQLFSVIHTIVPIIDKIRSRKNKSTFNFEVLFI